MTPANLRENRKVANLAARQRWQIRSLSNLTRLHCPQARFVWTDAYLQAELPIPARPHGAKALFTLLA